MNPPEKYDSIPIEIDLLEKNLLCIRGIQKSHGMEAGTMTKKDIDSFIKAMKEIRDAHGDVLSVFY